MAAVTVLERVFSPRWFQRFAIVVFGFYARVFRGLRVTGADLVPREGPLVVACNHFSAWDPPIVGVAIPRPLDFMAKVELFSSPLAAAFMRGLGAFPVDRSRGDVGAIKEALRRLRQGRAIGVFIQGTRNVGDAEALDGAAYLALASGAPVTPAAVWLEGRSFRVAFGEPIRPEGKGREAVKALTAETERRIRSLLPPKQQNTV